LGFGWLLDLAQPIDFSNAAGVTGFQEAGENISGTAHVNRF